MIYVDLPSKAPNGPGVCGDSLTNALATVAPVERLLRRPETLPLPGPLLQMVTPILTPLHHGLSATRRIGYAIFENDVWVTSAARASLREWDVVATACTWAEEALRQGQVTNVTTIYHGVDHARFNPSRAIRRRWRDRFVVFSGGKFEFRKAQDVVVQAFGAFASRHPDALLVAAWHNVWPRIMRTMSASPYYPFVYIPDESFDDAIQRWLMSTDLDSTQMELMPLVSQDELAPLYGDTDVGLFPNRCEGATNLILMEYMACGRTAIVTDFSGHRDIISDANGYPLRGSRRTFVPDLNEPLGCWCEPNVEEIVERLEEVYRSRDGLAARASRAAKDMAMFTWDRAARQFLDLLTDAA